MKVCVCSDSHGNRQGLQDMLNLEKPDALLFSGDGLEDFKGLDIPEKSLFVKGNCDLFSDEPLFREFTWEGVKIIMAHGHRFSVKVSPQMFLYEAYERDAQVAIYGHTHVQRAEMRGGVLLLNGGTMGAHYEYYAILTLENGKFDCELKYLPPPGVRDF